VSPLRDEILIASPQGYSIITYLLQIKDRHNGNILIDRDGHVIHIDFGFMLSNSPGNIGFEAAPFKLPFEYVEIMGGVESEAFREYKRLVHEGFEAARKHSDRIISEYSFAMFFL
jgi:phosphatidylinositol 4-kinase